ncbi:WxL domain-containing protein [Dellaglioa algida]|nr:WxL domain-containing protein [Dellaglioa algida]MDK1732135.1 WxL domain-containing protein [Dellaglioa algida]MDK1733661.1 WxL domain-containing protein [Dellaglioa algida]
MKRVILGTLAVLSGFCIMTSKMLVQAASEDHNMVQSDLSMVFQSGVTTIDFASSLNFNMAKIDTTAKKSYAKAQRMATGISTPNYVQVSNFSGTENGWMLEAKQSRQFESQNSHKILTGAYVSFSQGDLASISTDKKPGFYKKDFDLSVGANKVVVAANGDEGFGTWVYRFGNEDTKGSSIALNIPRETSKMADVYHSEIMWSLNSVPANE